MVEPFTILFLPSFDISKSRKLVICAILYSAVEMRHVLILRHLDHFLNLEDW